MSDFKRLVTEGVRLLGSQTALAAAIDAELDPRVGLRCTPQKVNNWLKRDLRFPPEYAWAFQRATRGKIKRYDLCPGIFKEPKR